MKPIVAADNSLANIHSIFMGKCDVGGRAFGSGLCWGNWNLNANCHHRRKTPRSMAFVVAHEIGHNLGNLKNYFNPCFNPALAEAQSKLTFST